MATVTIKSPPDGNDVTTAFVQRFQAVLPQGLSVKDALIGLAKFYVRQRELQLYRQQQTALASGNVQTKAGELSNDPDVGGSDF